MIRVSLPATLRLITMISSLVIKDSPEMRQQIKIFEQIISAYGIKIKNKFEIKALGTIELKIEDNRVNTIRAVAYDCFGNIVIINTV